MELHEEAATILEQKQLEQEWGYNQDPRYQRLSASYLAACQTENWKEAHRLLMLINLIKERFQHGEWVLNGEWK